MYQNWANVYYYICHHHAAIYTAAAGQSPATNIVQVEWKRSFCTIYHETEGTAMWTSFFVVYAVIFFKMGDVSGMDGLHYHWR